jgi:hypothetical protein
LPVINTYEGFKSTPCNQRHRKVAGDCSSVATV